MWLAWDVEICPPSQNEIIWRNEGVGGSLLLDYGREKSPALLGFPLSGVFNPVLGDSAKLVC